MATLHQYDYLMAFGTIFALLDAFNIGANDCANSFATSVSSHSLSYRQAIGCAVLFEFLGAVLAGSRVTSFIKNGIIDLDIFANDPGMLILGMVCAICGSSLWLTFATRNSMAVSTTHSIVGALTGVGIAAGGGNAVRWGWDGLAQVFASWGIAPGVAGGFGAIIYLTVKYGVLQRENSVQMGMIMIPIWFFIAVGILTMSIIWKGAPNLNLDELSTGATVGGIFGTAFVAAILSIIFILPFVHRKINGDYELRAWHIFWGPLLLRRPFPPGAENFTAVPDYYVGHHDAPAEDNNAVSATAGRDVEDTCDEKRDPSESEENAVTVAHPSALAKVEAENSDAPKFIKPWWNPNNFRTAFKNPWWTLKNTLLYGFFVDVHELQAMGGDDKEAARIKVMHTHAKQYDNKTEHMFSFLQVLTACTNSFAHGSNDISNAVGPFVAIYLTWKSGSIEEKGKGETPVWTLAMVSLTLGLGFALWGYNLVRILGNRITLHSPTRGFAMELGAATTVVIASRLSLPISTTQCLVGSTVAVSLCNGTVKGTNWRVVAWIMFGWVVTVPAAGLIAGCLMGIIINAPRFGYSG